MINTLVSIFSVCFLTYVILSEYGYMKQRRRNKLLLRGLDCFILEVRHYFYHSGLIAYAMREAAERSDRMLRPYVRCIAEILENADTEGYAETFDESLIKKYLKLICLLSQHVDEYGDTVLSDGGSGFLQNLMFIRMDIKTELRLLEKSEHLFMGFVMTASLPASSMTLIASWACDTIPQLTSFYYGRGGVLLAIAIMLITCVCCSSIVRLREGRNVRHLSIPLIIRIIEKSFAGMLIEKVIVKNYTRALRHKEMLRRLGERYSVTVLYFRQVICLLAGIAVVLLVYLDGAVINSLRAIDAAIIPLTLVGSFFYPYVILKLRSAISGDRMQEEIADLHTAISTMTGKENVSAIGMLEVMESFADIFKPAIRRCIDSFNIDEQTALDRMKQEEHNELFGRIVDCFYRIDDLGIEGAFGEISDDRKSFREYRDQESVFVLEDRSRLAMLLAILPGLLVLFAYLLIPFMTEALGMFESYAVNIEGAL